VLCGWVRSYCFGSHQILVCHVINLSCLMTQYFPSGSLPSGSVAFIVFSLILMIRYLIFVAEIIFVMKSPFTIFWVWYFWFYIFVVAEVTKKHIYDQLGLNIGARAWIKGSLQSLGSSSLPCHAIRKRGTQERQQEGGRQVLPMHYSNEFEKESIESIDCVQALIMTRKKLMMKMQDKIGKWE